MGHLEQDADAGEDKVGKKARLEQLEPMEVVQKYINSYHRNMHQLNVLDPGIEPLASGHVIDQQGFVSKIIKSGFAYEVNGSVYFDLKKYNSKYEYGKLSGRVLEDLLSYTRELEGREEKKNPYDFAFFIEKIITNSKLRLQISNYNYNYAKEHFWAEKVISRLENIYNTITKK